MLFRIDGREELPGLPFPTDHLEQADCLCSCPTFCKRPVSFHFYFKIHCVAFIYK